MKRQQAIRIPPPNSGLRRSDYTRVGFNAQASGQLRKTPWGTRGEVLVCEEFEVLHDVIVLGNATDMVQANSGKCTFHVLEGVLYVVEQDSSGKKSIKTFHKSNNYTPGNDVAYQLASSGTQSVELYICRSSKYEENLKVISVGSFKSNNDILLGNYVPPLARRDTSKAQLQAQELQRKVERRVQGQNLKHQNVVSKASESPSFNATVTTELNPKPIVFNIPRE